MLLQSLPGRGKKGIVDEVLPIIAIFVIDGRGVLSGFDSGSENVFGKNVHGFQNGLQIQSLKAHILRKAGFRGIEAALQRVGAAGGVGIPKKNAYRILRGPVQLQIRLSQKKL